MKHLRTGRIFASILSLILCMMFCACPAGAENRFDGMTAEEIVAGMTLEQKASQMVQPACYNLSAEEMQIFCYGSILSQGAHLNAEEWQDYTASFQKAALASDAGIPYIYGQDDVHGVNYCVGAVYFPQNIGMGAANDEDLMYRVGKITADEAKLCHMLWNFAPVVAQSADPAGAAPMRATVRISKRSEGSAQPTPAACWKKALSSARSIFSGTATWSSVPARAGISPG